MNQPKNFRYLWWAIALGLSWFLLFYVSSYISSYLPTLLHQPNILVAETGDTWELFSLPRLLLGIIFYWLAIPIIIKKFTRDRYLDIVGLNISKKNLGLTLLFIIFPLLITYLLPYHFTEWNKQYFTNWHYALSNAQPPLIEEVIMRGLFVYLMVKGNFNKYWIVSIGALIFSSYHFMINGVAGFITGIASIVVMYFPTFYTGNILSAIVNHSLMNAGLFTPTCIGTIIALIINSVILRKIKSS